MWLPGIADGNLDGFLPDFALINRSNPRYLKFYPKLGIGEKRDGVIKLTQLKIERSGQLFDAQPMTKDEETLKKDIAARKYAYLYGMRFPKEQWSRSEDLRRLLLGGSGIVEHGKPTRRGHEVSEVWPAFFKFNSGIAMKEKMQRELFGFEFSEDAWTPLPYPGVYWYREGLKEEPRPVWISYRGHRFDQQQHELLFDSTTEQLVVFWRYALQSLDLSDSTAR